MSSIASKAPAGSPYRTSCPTLPCKPDADPAPIFASVLLLVISLARLLPPFQGAEAFGAEPTLALLAVPLTSAHLLGALRAWRARPAP